MIASSAKIAVIKDICSTRQLNAAELLYVRNRVLYFSRFHAAAGLAVQQRCRCCFHRMPWELNGADTVKFTMTGLFSTLRNPGCKTSSNTRLRCELLSLPLDINDRQLQSKWKVVRHIMSTGVRCSRTKWFALLSVWHEKISQIKVTRIILLKLVIEWWQFRKKCVVPENSRIGR